MLNYDLLVHAYSNLVFIARAVQTHYEPGAAVELIATLREYDVPVEGRARVWAEIARPDGSPWILPLAEEPDGRHTTNFGVNQPGVYRVRVRARGETFNGTPFTREQSLTAVAVVGGDRSDTAAPPDMISELLCCLQRNGALKPELIKQWLPGIDPEAILRCVGQICAARRAFPEGPTKYRRPVTKTRDRGRRIAKKRRPQR